jgi:hypothetical protein
MLVQQRILRIWYQRADLDGRLKPRQRRSFGNEDPNEIQGRPGDWNDAVEPG